MIYVFCSQSLLCQHLAYYTDWYAHSTIHRLLSFVLLSQICSRCCTIHRVLLSVLLPWICPRRCIKYMDLCSRYCTIYTLFSWWFCCHGFAQDTAQSIHCFLDDSVAMDLLKILHNLYIVFLVILLPWICWRYCTIYTLFSWWFCCHGFAQDTDKCTLLLLLVFLLHLFKTLHKPHRFVSGFVVTGSLQQDSL